jgi:predicted metal-dependent phosphoesterase TrpH
LAAIVEPGCRLLAIGPSASDWRSSIDVPALDGERHVSAHMDDAGSIDIHLHPAGDRLRGDLPLADWVATLAATALDVAVITDHNAIDTFDGLRDLLGGRGPELVRGEEITTREGHLLGLGVDRPVPAKLIVRDAIAAVHDAGGLAIIAHPLLPTRISVSSRTIHGLADEDERHRPDGIETFNPLAARFPMQLQRVRAIAVQLELSMVGGSDAHVPRDLAQGRTRFPGQSFIDFRRAVALGQTSPDGEIYPLARTIRDGVVAVLSSRLRLRF